MKKLLFMALLCLPIGTMAQIDIAIDSDFIGSEISPMLYGIFYEDINHAADGGIYAELIRNRSFEDGDTLTGVWEPYLSVGGDVQMELETKNLLNDVQKHCLHVVTTKVGDTDAGVLNTGFWGINAVKGREYILSLWIKVKKGNNFYAYLKGKNGTHLYATTKLNVDTKDKNWQHVTAQFTSSDNDENAVFVISAKGNADFYLDVVSLFPPTYKDRPNGCRSDLAEMLEGLHPTFMRFPGGCFVEGMDTPDNAFRWDRTVGPIEERPGHDNTNWGYRTSDGLGFHEYLQLAEDLGAKPLYVCNIGIWHGGVTPLSDIKMWVDECLNAIEYANGPVSSQYGKLRADNGHPEPFNLEYIEIGNENNQDDGGQTSDNYYERYRIFREAILSKYPTMTIIGDVASWGTDEPRWHSNDKVDLVDEHYYRSPMWFTSNFKKYDAYSRSQPKVYCGEYAVTQHFGKVGNLNAALGEAVFMMGFENNADIVKMSSYAPIFVNENDCKWMPDMVRFNNHSVMGTPSYYVQKLMAENKGYRTLKVTQGDEHLVPVKAMYTPRESHVGVISNGTVATYRDIEINVGKEKIEVSATMKNEFEELAKEWSLNGDGITWTIPRGRSAAVVVEPIKSRKYSASVKAKKESGYEGLILVFNYVDNKNYCWLSIGGSTNTANTIEHCIDGHRMTVARAEGSIENDKWYDIRVEVDDNYIKAYLDGKEILTASLTGSTLPGIFTSASMDKTGEEMIVKIVNTSEVAETAHLNFGSFKTSGGELIQLKATSGQAENSLQSPTNVYPTRKHISLSETAPEFVVEPFSMNILRLRRK